MKKILNITFCTIIVILLMPLFTLAITVDVTDEITLQAALVDVSEETIVNILNDIEVTSKVKITGTGPVTINGNGNKVYATENNTDRVFELTAADDILNVTFKSITIENAFFGGTLAGRGVDTRTDNITLNFDGVIINTTSKGNNQPLTIGGSKQGGTVVSIKNSSFNAGVAGYAVISFVKTTVDVENSTLEGYAAFYMKEGSSNSIINVKDSTITGNNTHSGASNTFGTFVFRDENITVNITDSAVSAIGSSSAYHSPFVNGTNINGESNDNKVTVSGDKSIIKIENVAEVPQLIDSETGTTIGSANEFAYNNEKLDITFNAGVTTKVEIGGTEKAVSIPTEYLPANTVVTKKADGTLLIAVKHNVKVNETKNGSFIVDRIQAIVGELIKITTTPDVDYELDTITVVDADGKEIKVNIDGTFAMPDSEVTVTVSFRENPNPNTADGIGLYFISATISLIVIVGVTYKIKRYN